MEQQVKQVPYGVADFVTVMTQNLYYFDKTMFLPELEKQPRNLFFIRPRCFGKMKKLLQFDKLDGERRGHHTQDC